MSLLFYLLTVYRFFNQLITMSIKPKVHWCNEIPSVNAVMFSACPVYTFRRSGEQIYTSGVEYKLSWPYWYNSKYLDWVFPSCSCVCCMKLIHCDAGFGVGFILHDSDILNVKIWFWNSTPYYSMELYTCGETVLVDVIAAYTII